MSERKIYGRLGIRPPYSQQGVQGTLKVPPLLDLSGSRSWDGGSDPLAPHKLVEKAKRRIERDFSPVAFTDFNLRANQWIHFDLDMAHLAVHEDSGRPPEDVALFIGSVSSGTAGQQRDMGVLLCGSVQHLRTRAIPAGRMGSDTTWLHDLILKIERREEEGVNVIPEFLSEIMPTDRSEHRIEETAHGVFGWADRQYPPIVRGRHRGHAIVLMDIDNTRWVNRLLVASPLYVEAVPHRVNSSRRRFGMPRRRRDVTG
ncbi:MULTISPECIES: SAVMC3_10250 family protein [Streptomyces]|uniref:SAVMC3_10250 family protein n=1 Tax=Streptomyces TaxID=1883 RepID=UPI00227D7E15|nr:SAVMC3_10250 family protein [Streptomyces sp. MC1]